VRIYIINKNNFVTIFASAQAARSSVPRWPQKKILIDVKKIELKPLNTFEI
jgi:hypothetical protein